MRFAEPPPDIVSPTADIAAATVAFAEQTDGFARATAVFAEQTAAFARATDCFAAPPPDIAAATDDIAAGAAGFAGATECFALGENEVVRGILRTKLVSYGDTKDKERLATNYTNATNKLSMNYNSPAVNGTVHRWTQINTDDSAEAELGFSQSRKGHGKVGHECLSVGRNYTNATNKLCMNYNSPAVNGRGHGLHG